MFRSEMYFSKKIIVRHGFYVSYVSIAILLLVSIGCVKKIPYEGYQLSEFRQRKGNLLLHFTTDKGQQVAFYLPPNENSDEPPGKIVILYPGIHSLALDWLDYIRFDDDPSTGYILIDYPGRGLCEGRMHPEENYKNSQGALAALAEHFNVKSIQAEISLIGHSFGSGAALQFAQYRNAKRIVLVAPYNTLSKAVALKSKVLAFLMPAEIENSEQIRALLQKDLSTEITIVHGAEDATLPVSMGRELAEIDAKRIVYYEIPGGDHMSVLKTHRDFIFHTLVGKQ